MSPTLSLICGLFATSCRWAVGVLVYFMLQNELPFGSWQDSELDTFGRIARRQLDFPTNLSAEVVDLIDKVFYQPDLLSFTSIGLKAHSSRHGDKQ